MTLAAPEGAARSVAMLEEEAVPLVRTDDPAETRRPGTSIDELNEASVTNGSRHAH